MPHSIRAQRSRLSSWVAALVLVSALIAPSSCLPRDMPAETETPLAPAPPTRATCVPAHCDPPPEWVGRDLAIEYIERSYPESGAARVKWENLERSGEQPRWGGTWVTEDWIVSMDYSEQSVVITNTTTGFRWEGTVKWQAYNYPCCIEQLYSGSIVETSVTTPLPEGATRAAAPTATMSAPERSRLYVGGAVSSVAISPDGQTLAVGSENPTILLWDTTLHRPLGQTPPLHKRGVGDLAFSPDGKTLASGGYDGTILLWDVSTRLPVIGQPLTEHRSSVLGVAFSRDRTLLASAGSDNSIILYEVSDVGRPRATGRTDHGAQGPVRSVAFSPDGKTLASAGDDGRVVLWDLSDVAPPRPIGQPLTHKGPVNSIGFSPDGTILAAGCGDTSHPEKSENSITLWDLATHQPLGAPLLGHKSPVETLAFSPDGNVLASAGGDFLNAERSDNSIILWDISTRQPIGNPLAGHTQPVRSVAFSPDGKLLASGSEDRTVILWDVSDPRSPSQVLWDTTVPQ